MSIIKANILKEQIFRPEDSTQQSGDDDTSYQTTSAEYLLVALPDAISTTTTTATTTTTTVAPPRLLPPIVVDKYKIIEQVFHIAPPEQEPESEDEDAVSLPAEANPETTSLTATEGPSSTYPLTVPTSSAHVFSTNAALETDVGASRRPPNNHLLELDILSGLIKQGSEDKVVEEEAPVEESAIINFNLFKNQIELGEEPEASLGWEGNCSFLQ